MATECIKNCCQIFQSKKKEPESQASEGDLKKSIGVSEDYIFSKLPPDGKEVPFVVPTFKPSYIQPRGSGYPSYQTALQSSARTTYTDRKAELTGTGHNVYDPYSTSQSGNIASYVSPGLARRPTLKTSINSPSSAWDRSGNQRLSISMFDLSSSHTQIQRNDSVSSVQSSTSSMKDSFGSSRSLESITLSGDEKERDRELGKVYVQLSYQEAVEQVWITLVQCSDMSGVEQQKIGIKGVITMAKPVQFKSSVKEASQDTVFMETFVFTLSLQQLRSCALVLRLQTHTPRKRTIGECALSLRQLGTRETYHWLEFRPPSKNHMCHAELQLATCFQPVSSRIQLQVLSAQNLPSSSSPLGQSFFVRVEMYSQGRLLLKRKTRVLRSSGGLVQWGEALHFPLTAQDHDLQLLVKLCSRSSVRRKHFLGQVHLGFDSPCPVALEQWTDSISHPEKVVTAWHSLTRP
ncbi:tandem C2 domains nuclear protein [Chanos chanos]|uniref:Tandem C2 domains nuclear protein n=1 Tax=Chanos chanos TaxID=29144 RepID=A0A6J2V8T9_CHACN|nr:tandem C2 domains nuclear protein [Chanos chanos]